MTFSNTYSVRSGLVLGFHGTDESLVRDIVLNNTSMKSSNNSWDWIGHGIYFWEHSPPGRLNLQSLRVKEKETSKSTSAWKSFIRYFNPGIGLLSY